MGNILVTGGAGYIGSHIVKNMLSAGHTVVVLDNLVAGKKENIPASVKLIVADITDQEALKNIFSSHRFDAVFHLAALVNAAESVEKRDEYLLVDQEGTRYLVNECISHGVKKFLFSSSAAVYGNKVGREPVAESFPTSPSSPYGEAKLGSEKIIMGSGLNYGIFRFFNVIGSEEGGNLGSSPGSRAILTRLLSVASGKVKEIEISGNDYGTLDGTVVRDFVHVEDIARAFNLGFNHLSSGKDSFLVNLGSGRTTSMKALKIIVEQITGKSIPVTYGPRNAGDIAYSQADIARAKEILDWEPKEDLTTMVESSWKYYEKHSH